MPRQVSLTALAIMGMVAMLVATFALLAFSTGEYRTLAYATKESSVKELIELQAKNIYSDLTEDVFDFGIRLATQPSLRDLTKNRDVEGISSLLDSQFHQYDVTSGHIKLARIYLLDPDHNLISKSTEGTHLADDSGMICQHLVDVARVRTGADRLKTESGLCASEGMGFLGVLKSLATFRPYGYALIVVDAAYALRHLEAGLGLPIQVTHSGGALAFESKKWAEEIDEAGDEEHFLVTHALADDAGHPVAEVQLVEHIGQFHDAYNNTVFTATSSAFVGLSFMSIIGLLVLRNVLNSLRSLKGGAERLANGQFEPLPPTRFLEFNSLVSGFNAMAEKTSTLIDTLNNTNQTLQDEVAVRERAEKTSREQAERIRAIYDVAAMSGATSCEEQLAAMLEVGCRLFNLPMAFISKFDSELDRYTIIQIHASKESLGEHAPRVGNDIGQVPFDAGDALFVDRMGESAWANSELHRQSRFESYIGTKLYTNDQLFGTIGFADTAPRNTPFSDTDLDLVRLIGRLAGATLERHQVLEQLEVARNDAERASLAKSEFLANMSHEIRTPMNAILGYAQILKRDSSLAPTHRHAVETVTRAGNHLLGLINEILDLSKIEAGRMQLNLAALDLVALLRDLAEMFALRCAERGLEWNVDILADKDQCIVFGDEGKLRQVLINLIGNAVKFTHEGGVTLRVTAPSEHSYCFEVTDTGPGIAQDAQATIFDAFTQVEDASNKGGTGLGLAIAYKQIELMGGELKLRSQVGVGSQFYFTLSLVAASSIDLDAQNPYRAVKSLHLVAPARALVVDDIEVNRQLLRQMLEEIGYQVDEAKDGVHALEVANQTMPDIVFMDFRMPNMNGSQATVELRRRYGDELPVVMVTASVLEHQEVAFSEAGVNATVRKPFTFEHIAGVLVGVVGEGHFSIENETANASPADDDVAMALDASNVPDELLAEIEELADLGSVSDLEDKLAELREVHAALADHLKSMTDAFKLSEVATVVKGLQKATS